MSVSKCDRCGEIASDLDSGLSPGVHQMGHDCGGTWRVPAQAFLAGYADGLAWDLDGYEDRAEVERDAFGWDEATINAIGVARFCELCGIDPDAEGAWGPACADYNAGALAGVLSDAHHGLPPRGSE